MNRRRFLAGLAGTLVVAAGYDPRQRRWMSEAEASGCPSFARAPDLDGALVFDPAARAAAARDFGNIVHRTPCAVLRPGSVTDIARMVTFCRDHGIKVAARGLGHTMHGQSLCDGLVIDSTLREIHSIGPAGADVDAGVLWSELLLAAHEHGLTPAVLTGFTVLTVGGTLSVGGTSRSFGRGAQVDHVQELEVVTGAGDVERCSAEHNRELFEATLAGLGQCAVITRAKVDLVPAPAMARTYDLHYVDHAPLFRDLRTLTRRGELADVVNLWVPPGTSPAGCQIQATVFYDASRPPDNDHLMRDLTLPAAAIPFTDSTYLDYAQQLDRIFATYRASGGWDDAVKPWFDVWLPDQTVEAFVDDVVPTLTPTDVGPTGLVFLVPQRRSRLTGPLLRIPEPDGTDWVYTFHILTSSARPGTDPTFAAAMLTRNRRLFERARQAGATRIPVGALDFTADDWVRHYGDRWLKFAASKHRFDPDHILTPGPNIFGNPTSAVDSCDRGDEQ